MAHRQESSVISPARNTTDTLQLETIAAITPRLLPRLLSHCRYSADETAVSAFFQNSPAGSVKVDSFSPVKRGSMNTGDAVLRVGKGLGACLEMNVRSALRLHLQP